MYGCIYVCTVFHCTANVVTQANASTSILKLLRNNFIFIRFFVRNAVTLLCSNYAPLKGHFGDNDESYQLFDTFTKLGNNYEKNGNYREIWDGFKTDQKYDHFGIFVNWAKMYDKKLNREVNDKIKTLVKNDNYNKKITIQEASLESKGQYDNYIEFDILTSVGASMLLIKCYPNKLEKIKR